MNILKLINEAGCFDLQFRRDVKSKRTNSPTYYSWKAQFAIAAKIDKEKFLREIQNTLNCGRIHYITGTQLRYSVQAVDELCNIVVPFFETNQLSGKKKQDFELWAEAINIIYRNKGKKINAWSREDFQALIDRQEAMLKYKVKKTQASKWLPMAQSVAETLA